MPKDDLEWDAERLLSLGFKLHFEPADEAIFPDEMLESVAHVRTACVGINLAPKDVEITIGILRQGGLWIIDNRGGGKSYKQLMGEEAPQWFEKTKKAPIDFSFLGNEYGFPMQQGDVILVNGKICRIVALDYDQHGVYVRCSYTIEPGSKPLYQLNGVEILDTFGGNPPTG